MFEHLGQRLSKFGGNLKNNFMDAAIRSMTGNPESCRKLVNDIADQVLLNMRRLSADFAMIELFPGGKSLGKKIGYGIFPIDRDELLVFGFMPKGALTFERIKSFMPKTISVEQKITLWLSTENDAVTMQVNGEQNEPGPANILIHEKLNDFLFNSLYNSPEEMEQVKEDLMNVDFFGDNEGGDQAAEHPFEGEPV